MINNGFINTIDANIIARKYMHRLEKQIIGMIENELMQKIEFEKKEREELDDIYDNFTIELEDESEQGLLRDWREITKTETMTENQIKRIYYELKKNKEKISFTDADLIIKILIDYNNMEE